MQFFPDDTVRRGRLIALSILLIVVVIFMVWALVQRQRKMLFFTKLNHLGEKWTIVKQKYNNHDYVITCNAGIEPLKDNAYYPSRVELTMPVVATQAAGFSSKVDPVYDYEEKLSTGLTDHYDALFVAMVHGEEKLRLIFYSSDATKTLKQISSLGKKAPKGVTTSVTNDPRWQTYNRYCVHKNTPNGRTK